MAAFKFRDKAHFDDVCRTLENDGNFYKSFIEFLRASVVQKGIALYCIEVRDKIRAGIRRNKLHDAEIENQPYNILARYFICRYAVELGVDEASYRMKPEQTMGMPDWYADPCIPKGLETSPVVYDSALQARAESYLPNLRKCPGFKEAFINPTSNQDYIVRLFANSCGGNSFTNSVTDKAVIDKIVKHFAQEWATQPIQKEEIIMANIDTTKAVQTITYVFGKPFDDVTDDQVFQHVAKLEGEIKNLDSIENKSQKLVKRIQALKENTKELNTLVDAR